MKTLDAATRSPVVAEGGFAENMMHAVARAKPRLDAAPEWPERVLLRRKDFEHMTAEELQAAKEALVEYGLQLPAAASRELVVLADVSGPMERYSAMLLHFVHAISSRGRPVHAFACGSRLASFTRYLRHCDGGAALEAGRCAATDWVAGPRMAHCVAEVNRRASRRMRGARVLLITHGVTRTDTEALAAEMARLRRSCAELIWLNPLLRRSSFEAKAAGIQPLLPHVDHFLPVHNLQSLAALALHLRVPLGLSAC